MSHPAGVAPEPAEYGGEFGRYISLLPPGDVLVFLDAQLTDLLQLLARLPEHESLVHHAPYTWSIRQVIGHMIDCERIFGCRALRLARNDATPLPTFDEQAYMQNCDFDRSSLADLLTEFEHLRRSHLSMLRRLSPETWLHRGTVSGETMSTRAMAFVLAGHAQHHLEILHRRLQPHDTPPTH